MKKTICILCVLFILLHTDIGSYQDKLTYSDYETNNICDEQIGNDEYVRHVIETSFPQKEKIEDYYFRAGTYFQYVHTFPCFDHPRFRFTYVIDLAQCNIEQYIEDLNAAYLCTYDNVEYYSLCPELIDNIREKFNDWLLEGVCYRISYMTINKTDMQSKCVFSWIADHPITDHPGYFDESIFEDMRIMEEMHSN